MLCAVLLQVESPVPAPVLQLGTAVAICYMVMLITRQILEFAGKNTKTQAQDPHSSRTEYRLDKLDEEMKERITRTEYESRHADILRQLNRIESKLDRMTGSRAVFTGESPEGGR